MNTGHVESSAHSAGWDTGVGQHPPAGQHAESCRWSTLAHASSGTRKQASSRKALETRCWRRLTISSGSRPSFRRNQGWSWRPPSAKGSRALRSWRRSLGPGQTWWSMATRGRSGLQRAIIGSVAERTLVASPVPVLLQRPGGKRVKVIKRLLVPVDGSPGGALAQCAGVSLNRAEQDPPSAFIPPAHVCQRSVMNKNHDARRLRLHDGSVQDHTNCNAGVLGPCICAAMQPAR